MARKIPLLALFFILHHSLALAASDSLPHISIDQILSGESITLSNLEGWKYSPGDNPEWANPDFDDSDWFSIVPSGLRPSAMPDSLWNGYGWFRFAFTADSTIYENAWHFYFFAWGGAEVYVDGALFQTFGTFSANPELEIPFAPYNRMRPAISLTPKERHLIAVRFSNHQAKSTENILGLRSGNLGFGMIFMTFQDFENNNQVSRIRLILATASAVILFILLILHLVMFWLIPGEKSNLLISITLALLFLSCIGVYNDEFFGFTNFWYYFNVGFVWMYSFILAVNLLPATLALMFRFEWYYKLFYLTLLTLIYAVVDTFFAEFIGYFSIAHFLILVIASAFVIYHAWKKNASGVLFLTLGSIGLLITALLWTLQSMLIISVSAIQFYLIVLFVYSLFPLGLTVFTAQRLGIFYNKMESEVLARTKDLRDSIQKLRSAQEQLIQQEKLASLGQLTAGIAHEIKNPLNFVNNFADLSIELIDELNDDFATLSPELQEQIDRLAASNNSKFNIHNSKMSLGDIKANLRKIHEHGTRADSIVKSMLMHSRGGSGVMELVHVNNLVKEYVNLAFHGMRAGKNPINVDIRLELDDSIGEVPLIAEDFSRVILNLAGNAFDACAEVIRNSRAEGARSARSSGAELMGAEVTLASPDQLNQSSELKIQNYIPILTVRTKSESNHVVIEISDNGPGIPDNIKDSILLPFFTTKKGKDGTGLGLSITHDIIKAHGGTLEIQSQPGETTFRITLIRT
jgi:signal transduction histidine kinase